MTAMAEAPATTQLARDALGDASGDLGLARAQLFERILGRVHAYFQRLVSDPDAAEECAQETLLVLERSLDTFELADDAADPRSKLRL